MMPRIDITKLAFMLLIVGALNWGAVAIYDKDAIALVGMQDVDIMGLKLPTLVYMVVFFSALWLIKEKMSSPGPLRI